MMPQTVPNRPMNGAVLAAVASRARDDLSRDISSSMPWCSARRTLLSISLSASPVALMRLNSFTARLVMPKRGETRSPVMAGRAADNSPDSSKRAIPEAIFFRAEHRVSHFPAMYAQLVSDMQSSKASTPLETSVACITA